MLVISVQRQISLWISTIANSYHSILNLTGYDKESFIIHMVLLASEYILVISLFNHAFLLHHFSVNETQTTSFKEKQ